MFGMTADQPAGRTSANPMPQKRLKEQFEDCRALTRERTARVYSATTGFEKLACVRAVS